MSDLFERLRTAVARLGRLDLADIQRQALAEAADSLRDEVRRSLSVPPGGGHDTPWRRTGTLEDSIGATVDGSEAVIGSTDPVAVDQELGTRSIPPRPFLAPAAARASAAAAERVGEAVARALREAAAGALK